MGGGSHAETRRELDEVTGAIIDCSIRLHQSVGPGLLESVYEAILARDLMRRGLKVERQKLLRFEYDGMVFEEGLRLDLLVDDRVIVELKSVETIHPVHKKQLLTYLRLAHQPVGLLINFGASDAIAPTCRFTIDRLLPVGTTEVVYQRRGPFPRTYLAENRPYR